MPRTTRQTPKAESLLARLHAAADEVPDDARRFHEVQERLTRRAEASAGQRLAWARRGDLQALADEVAALEAAVPWVTQLFGRVSSVRRKVLRLRTRMSDGANPEEASWIEDRCTGWEADLARIGATLPQPAAVSQAKKTVADLGDSIALHDDALDWLMRARAVLAELEAHDLALEGASLAAELPEIGAALRREPTRGAIDDLADRVRPLEERIDREPKEAPPEYSDADKTLAVVEDWHRHLLSIAQLPPEAPRELGDVRERLDVARRNWRREGAESGEAMLGEARALAERIREAARRRRIDAIGELRDQVRHLTQVADAGTDLAKQLTDLDERGAETGAAHVDWWRTLERVKDGFLADAEMAREELAERLGTRRDALRKEVGELERQPRGAPERARLFQIRADLQEIGRSREPIHVLEDLRRIDRLSESVREVAVRMEDKGRALRERVAGLRERDLTLRRAAGRSGTKARRLARRLRALERSDTSPSHEETVAEVEALERAVGEAERDFVRGCVDRFGELAGRWHRIARVLESAEAELDLGSPPHPPAEDALPERAAGVIEAAEARLEALDEAAAEVCTALEARRDRLLARLDGVSPGTLSPTDRDDAQALRSELERAGAPASGDDPVERIEALLPTLETGDELLARFARHEQEARRLRDTLARRFRALRSESLLDPGGALADRVEALLRGVPEAPVSWPDALGQLRHAQDLLDRLESHARRRVAARLATDVAVLEERRHRERSGEADRLLAELAAVDPYELPPATLRHRIHRRARALLGSEGRDRA